MKKILLFIVVAFLSLGRVHQTPSHQPQINQELYNFEYQNLYKFPIFQKKISGVNYEVNYTGNLNIEFPNFRSYGLEKGRCMAWVTKSLQSTGKFEFNHNVPSAWHFYTMMPDSMLTPFNELSLNDKDLFFIFGVYENSKYKNHSVKVIRKYATERKIQILKGLKDRKFGYYSFMPITHIGIMNKGQYADFIGRVRRDQMGTFIPLQMINVSDHIRKLEYNQNWEEQICLSQIF